MAISHRLLSTNITPIKTSQISQKLNQKPKENCQNYQNTKFLMAMISDLNPLWKLMRNCLMNPTNEKLPYEPKWVLKGLIRPLRGP